MNTYRGRREGCDVIVTVNGRPLNPRLDLRNHSPTGFEWGYCGSGPAQLALAILADHFGNDHQALAIYQVFKDAVIAGLPEPGWTLSSEQIEYALQSLSGAEKGDSSWTFIVPPAASRGMYIIFGTKPFSKPA
jgi:hypothetical protein